MMQAQGQAWEKEVALSSTCELSSGESIETRGDPPNDIKVVRA